MTTLFAPDSSEPTTAMDRERSEKAGCPPEGAPQSGRPDGGCPEGASPESGCPESGLEEHAAVGVRDLQVCGHGDGRAARDRPLAQRSDPEEQASAIARGDNRSPLGSERRDAGRVGAKGGAWVIHPLLRGADSGPRSAEACLEEATGLARAIALEVVGATVVRVNRPAPSTLIGAGAVEELAAAVEEQAIAVVIVDHALSPIQQRNLEKELKTKVIDRTGLILEIFGARARTREGQLQVELAALTYQRSRLVRSWTHLERQRGGFGFLGGPGESQIEMDRRLIGERILKIKRELEVVRRTRSLHRQARERVPYPVVALVGYTNAGKSTLFNRLARADVFAQDLLFATLDTTMRGVEMPSGRTIILSDTVGFISDLPHQLVAAFHATLEEVTSADLILHVRDLAHPDTEAQRMDVERVLAELGIEPASDGRLIQVLNKLDLIDPDCRPVQAQAPATGSSANDQDIRTQAISALTGEGIPALLALMDHHLNADRQVIDLNVATTDGALIAWLYRRGEVLERTEQNEGHTLALKVALDAADAARLRDRLAQAHADAGETS